MNNSKNGNFLLFNRLRWPVILRGLAAALALVAVIHTREEKYKR